MQKCVKPLQDDVVCLFGHLLPCDVSPISLEYLIFQLDHITDLSVILFPTLRP